MWTVAPGSTALSMNKNQTVLRDIIDALQSNPPKTPGMLDLNRDRDDRLGVGLPAEHSAFNAADRLVDLDVSGQPLARPDITIAVR